MNRYIAFGFAALLSVGACSKKAEQSAASSKVEDVADLAAAVPNSGPRTGNNYKVFLKMLRQNQAPAVGFKVDASVKGLSEPKTLVTDANGIVKFTDLPFPDVKHPFRAVFHYYNGKVDGARDISYPYLESDAYRMKDTQYIPNPATPDPQ